MNKKELLAQPMVICKDCGWEIARSAVWIEPICDDCAMDGTIQHNKEQGIRL
jgi:predicted Zn-ribbon and HTH transcriptional regulator